MPIQLLPASAQAFAPRSAPEIVIDRKETWLTGTLKRTNKTKRPLNSVDQHRRCLRELLGGEDAIWTLATIMLPKAPLAELTKNDNPLIEALYNFQVVSIEAYVVHVDLVCSGEVAYKLTPETIEALVDYHKAIFSVDVREDTVSWPEKEAALKKLHDDFVQAANKFVYRAPSHALDGLEEEGAGELLGGLSVEVKTAIMGLFQPLIAPPPQIIDVVRAVPLLPNTSMAGNYWEMPQPQPLPSHPAPVGPWRMLPSTPSPTATTCSDSQSLFMQHEMSNIQLPSPSPSVSLPYTSAPSQFYSSPQCMAPMATMAPVPAIQLDAMSSACGAQMGMYSYHDYSWSHNVFPSQFATAV